MFPLLQSKLLFTLFRMGLFGAAWGLGGPKKVPLSTIYLTNLSYYDETWYNYTLPKEDLKIYESRDTPLEFC